MRLNLWESIDGDVDTKAKAATATPFRFQQFIHARMHRPVRQLMEKRATRGGLCEPAASERSVWKAPATEDGERIEQSFAHCYDTGAMRKDHLGGHQTFSSDC